MFCKNCGSENLNEAKFCKNCGKEVVHFLKERPNEHLEKFEKNKKKIAIFGVALIILGGASVYFLWGYSASHDGNLAVIAENLANQIQSPKTVEFGERKINRELKGIDNVITDLDLVLPQLTGTYDGIPVINDYYNDKEKNFTADAEDFSKTNQDSVYPDDHSYVKDHFRLESITGSLISITGDGDWHPSGGAGSGNIKFYGDVFDLNTGKKITLDDIFSVDSEKYLDFIHSEVTRQIKLEMTNAESGSQYKYFFDFPDDVDKEDGQSSIAAFDQNNFYITDKALVVFYETGDLGPNSSGSIKFEIPFESVKDSLKKYFVKNLSAEFQDSKVQTNQQPVYTNNSWHTYTNDIYKYKFKYPEGTRIEEAQKSVFSKGVKDYDQDLTFDEIYNKYTGKICLSVIYNDGAVIISAPVNEDHQFILCGGRTGIGSESKVVSAKENISISGKIYTADIKDIVDDNEHNYLLRVSLEDGTRITISTSLLETKTILKKVVESYTSTN